MIHYLTEDEIDALIGRPKADEEVFGVLFEDGESIDCITLAEALAYEEKHKGMGESIEVYIYH